MFSKETHTGNLRNQLKTKNKVNVLILSQKYVKETRNVVR